MSPRTRLLALLGALGTLSACGAPPQPLPTAPPRATATGFSQPVPSVPVTIPGLGSRPAFPTPPPFTPPPATLPPATPPPPATTPPDPDVKAPTPTPSHAPKCTGAPTGAEILALIKGKPGVPAEPLRVSGGPYCATDWSFTVVEVRGENADEDEPLMVVATGKGGTLALIAAGQEVCLNRVQQEAPPGIRVLACGF